MEDWLRDLHSVQESSSIFDVDGTSNHEKMGHLGRVLGPFLPRC